MVHISDKLSGSLLGDIDNLVNDNNIIIQQFLKSTYNIYGSYNIYLKDGKNIVDIDGSIYVRPSRKFNINHLTDRLFKFGKVSVNFVCAGCPNLESLDGAPIEVGEDFNCDNDIKLTSLNGAPKKVKNFHCSDNISLLSIDDLPDNIDLLVFKRCINDNNNTEFRSIIYNRNINHILI